MQTRVLRTQNSKNPGFLEIKRKKDTIFATIENYTFTWAKRNWSQLVATGDRV